MKSIIEAKLENGTYEQIVSLIEKELELNGLEAPDELQINTVTQQATQQNSEKSKPNFHHCKKPSHYRNQYRQLKREKQQARKNTSSADNSNNNNGNGQTNSNSKNQFSENTNANNKNNQKDRRPGPVYPPCETCGKTSHSTKNVTLEPMQRTDRKKQPEGENSAQQRNSQSNSDENVRAAAQTLN